MSKALSELSRQFQQWRESPNKGRRTPPELIAGVARVLRTEPVSVVARQLGIGSSVIKKAQQLSRSAPTTCQVDPVGSSDPHFIELTQLIQNQPAQKGLIQQEATHHQSVITARINIGHSCSLHLQLTLEQIMQLVALGQGGRHQ